MYLFNMTLAIEFALCIIQNVSSFPLWFQNCPEKDAIYQRDSAGAGSFCRAGDD